MLVLDHVDEAQIRGLVETGTLFWLSLYRPSDGERARAGELLGLQRLAVEDSQQFGQRTKIDDYEGTALLVFAGLQTADVDGESLPVPVEVHFHITAHGVMTVRHEELETLDTARKQVMLAHVDRLEEALFRVLDALADSFTAPLATVAEEIDRLEDVVLEHPEPELRRRLLRLKRALVGVRHVVDPQRNVLASHRDLLDDIPGFDEREAHDLLRDLYDRLVLISQELDTLREIISNALDLYVSAISNRTNEVMKVLTIVATFFLPLTFITGFFGQNFGWLVRHIGSTTAFLVFGPGVTIVFVIGLYAAFVRAGYLSMPFRK